MSRRKQADFEAVLDKHFEQVYGYVAYRLAPDNEAAGDVTHETFLAACKSWPSFRGEGTALTWLRGIARRKIADHFRRRPLATEQLAAGAEAAEPRSPDDAIERATLVARIMRSLSNGQAELLEDKYLQGLSVREMARLRGASEQSVASALFRARQAFRQRFSKFQTNKEAQR